MLPLLQHAKTVSLRQDVLPQNEQPPIRRVSRYLQSGFIPCAEWETPTFHDGSKGYLFQVPSKTSSGYVAVMSKESGQRGGQATKANHGGLQFCSECGQPKPLYYSEIAKKQSTEAKRRGGITTASKTDMKERGRLGGRGNKRDKH
jgi:hypothetical protein